MNIMDMDEVRSKLTDLSSQAEGCEKVIGVKQVLDQAVEAFPVPEGQPFYRMAFTEGFCFLVENAVFAAGILVIIMNK